MTAQPPLDNPLLRELQAVFCADLEAARPIGEPWTPADLTRAVLATANTLDLGLRIEVERDPNDPNRMIVFYRLDE